MELDEAKVFAAELGLAVVPELFRGVVSNERDLRRLSEELAHEPSAFGGTREGVVIRVAERFATDDFSRSLAKWVRKDHVATDEHWLNMQIRPQRLAVRVLPS